MRGSALKLIAFIILTTALTAILGIVIGNFRPFSSDYELEAVFTDATGLLKADIVTLAGVEVGKVKDGRVEKGLAIVRMQIHDDVQIPNTSRVEIRFRNLVGQRMVVLHPEGSGPFLEDGDRIPVEQTIGPLDLGQVFNNLRPLVSGIDSDDVNTLSKALVESFLAHSEDLDAVLANAATLTEELASRDDRLASLIEGVGETAAALADEKGQLEALLSNFAQVTETLADNSPALERTIVDLDQAAGDIGKLIADNRSDLDQDLDDLVTLLALVTSHQSDLNQIANKLDDTLRATARGTTYGEWGNLYIFSLCASSDPDCLSSGGTSSSSSAATHGQPLGLQELLFSAAEER